MKQKNKITLVVSSLSGGGAEGVCINIANKFAECGWVVDLVVQNLSNESFLSRVSSKVNLVVLNVNHTRYSSISLLNYVRKSKINKVMVFSHELAVIFVIIRILFRLKINIISRNISILSIKIKKLEFQSFWTSNIVRPLIKHFYHKVDHVINQCQSMQDDLISLFPKLNHNSSVIYNPLSNHIADYVKNNNLTKIEKKNYLLCVGRLEEVKAIHYAIEGFASIASEFPKLRLKIVGQGSLEQKLKKKAIECLVEDRVDFEGFQENIVPYYLYAKATIQTSDYEGYPNVLIESIAMNTPVVAFNCPGGTHEIIQDGLNGYLAKHQNLDDLKKKLSMILLNKFAYKDLKNSINKNNTHEVFKRYEKLIISLN